MKTTIFIFLFLLHTLVSHAQSFIKFDPLKLPDGLERTYIKGLNYLKAAQLDDGTWKATGGYSKEPAVAGLCLMAFLSHGDDPESGPYAQNIKRCIDFIIKSARSDNGYIGNSMYNHGFATLALAEAYGVVNDERIGPALQKAVNLILSAQERNRFGAWRYTPDSQDADTTVSGACLVALYAAANAGIKVPDENIKKALKFFSECQSSDGGIGYSNSHGPNLIRTGIGTLVFALAKEKEKNEYIRAFRYIKNAQPQDLDNNYFHYGLYYLSQAFFHSSADEWERWNKTNFKLLASLQNDDGSWDSNFGREFGTAAALLSLALNYRYLPIYER